LISLSISSSVKPAAMTSARLAPPRDQLLFGLDGDRDPIIRTDPAARQLGGRVTRGGFDDLSL
jgi:hypothetical protein